MIHMFYHAWCAVTCLDPRKKVEGWLLAGGGCNMVTNHEPHTSVLLLAVSLMIFVLSSGFYRIVGNFRDGMPSRENFFPRKFFPDKLRNLSSFP